MPLPAEPTPPPQPLRRPWEVNYEWQRLSESGIQEIVNLLESIYESGRYNDVPLNTRERRELSSQLEEGRLELSRAHEIAELYPGEIPALDSEDVTHDVRDDVIPDSEEPPDFLTQYARYEAMKPWDIALHDLERNRRLLWVRKVYTVLLASVGYHIFNLVNSDCQRLCKTWYTKPWVCKRSAAIGEYPSRAITWDYGTPVNSRCHVLFVSRSNGGKSFSFKTMVDSESALILDPDRKKAPFPVVGVTRMSAPGLFGSLKSDTNPWNRPRKPKDEKEKKAVPITLESITAPVNGNTATMPPETAASNTVADDADVIPEEPVTSPPPEITAPSEASSTSTTEGPLELAEYSHGDAHDKCDGIYYFSEFASMNDLSAATWNKNMLNEFLEFLTSGRIHVRLKSGEYRHVSKMTVWGGIQPERVALAAGMFRRFAYIYVDATEEEELKRIQSLFSNKPLPPREEGFRVMRNKIAHLYRHFKVDRVQFTPEFKDYVMELSRKPDNAFYSDDAEVLIMLSIGYHVMRKWNEGDNQLTIELDDDLKAMLEQQVEWRRLVPLLGSDIGNKQMVWDHMKRDLEIHGRIPLLVERLRLIRNTSLPPDVVDEFIMFFRGLDKSGRQLNPSKDGSGIGKSLAEHREHGVWYLSLPGERGRDRTSGTTTPRRNSPPRNNQ